MAVAAHADDRDVFVLQVAGSGVACVRAAAGRAPVPSRQVDETPALAVPASALADANVVVDRTLRPGDVLYVPRGFVHEASTGAAEASLHVTLAVATHDWTWSRLLAGVLANRMDSADGAADLADDAAAADAAATRDAGDGGNDSPAPRFAWRRSVPFAPRR